MCCLTAVVGACAGRVVIGAARRVVSRRGAVGGVSAAGASVGVTVILQSNTRVSNAYFAQKKKPSKITWGDLHGHRRLAGHQTC